MTVLSPNADFDQASSSFFFVFFWGGMLISFLTRRNKRHSWHCGSVGTGRINHPEKAPCQFRTHPRLSNRRLSRLIFKSYFAHRWQGQDSTSEWIFSFWRQIISKLMFSGTIGLRSSFLNAKQDLDLIASFFSNSVLRGSALCNLCARIAKIVPSFHN